MQRICDIAPNSRSCRVSVPSLWANKLQWNRIKPYTVSSNKIRLKCRLQNVVHAVRNALRRYGKLSATDRGVSAARPSLNHRCTSWYFTSGIILSMGSASERRRCIVTSSRIGWAHTQNYLVEGSCIEANFHRKPVEFKLLIYCIR